MTRPNLNTEFWVEVKHRRPSPKRYTWEIHRKGRCLSVEESRDQFGSWEEASQVGNEALRQFLQASSDFFMRTRPFDTSPEPRSEERNRLTGTPVESVVALTVVLVPETPSL
jgi:hypothetical protein